MDRTASLLKSAKELKRKIWASLPLGFRILALFDRLADDSSDMFGRLIYAEFLRRGVEGLPPIRGKSADEYRALIGERGLKDKNLASKLPTGYGKAFAAKVRNILRRKYREDIVDEAMSRFAFRFHDKGSAGLKEGSNLTLAEGYVITGVKREAINTIEQEEAGVHGEAESLSGDEVNEERPIDIHDRSFLDKVEAQYPLTEMLRDPFVLRDLTAIARWVPDYLELALEGYTDDEIFGFGAGKGNSGSVPSVLADRIGYPYVPRPGSVDPLNRGIWSKRDVGVKDRIYSVLIDHAQGD